MLKGRGITAVLIHLMHNQDDETKTDAGLSLLMDAWILLLNREIGGKFNRELYLLKARGMAHSNQVREFFVMADNGIRLIFPYIGGGHTFTGSARITEEARECRAERRNEANQITDEIDRQRPQDVRPNRVVGGWPRRRRSQTSLDG